VTKPPETKELDAKKTNMMNESQKEALNQMPKDKKATQLLLKKIVMYLHPFFSSSVVYMFTTLNTADEELTNHINK